ncbi:MAG TPA: hypothetical protein VGE55_13745 [Limnobacter sp.]|uniref:hypothetical protein n=1 Tax=Limnobacter sp. TaxID=2003368 RepID=UPI002ED98C31
MYDKFEQLLNDFGAKRPSEKTPLGPVYYINEHPVRLIPGEMEGIHWMDIQIGLPRFRLENLESAKKVLQANREMGSATPIPTWFGLGDKQDHLVFINRLDWRHVDARVLEDHILRCIEQMGQALMTEGV